jgi:Ca-activated chloride channel family protein
MVTTRAGTPVTGLPKESFALRRDGRTLAIERFSEGDDVPLDLALVIDGSGSMLDDMERAKRSAADFLLATLDTGDQALLVDFDARPRLLHGATEDVAGLVDRFDDIRSGGGSSIYDAILFAALQLDGATGRRALVVVTDGLDSGSRISPADCADATRHLGVPVFVLSLEGTRQAPPSHQKLKLRDLAVASGGGLFEVFGANDLRSAYEAIETQLRGQYLLGFSVAAPLTASELDSLTLDILDAGDIADAGQLADGGLGDRTVDRLADRRPSGRSSERLVVRTILGGRIRGDG